MLALFVWTAHDVAGLIGLALSIVGVGVYVLCILISAAFKSVMRWFRL